MEKERKQDLVKISVPATYAMLSLIIKVFETLVYKFEFIAESENEIVSSLVEAYNNCIEHGYAGESPDKTVDIEFRVEKNVFQVRLVDYGCGFKKEEYVEYKPDKKEDVFRFRGRGIFLMRNFMDFFAIEKIEAGGTIVDMKMFFEKV